MIQPADNPAQLIEQIDEATYRTLKTAVELGKWDNGQRLSAEQVEYCLQAIIAWEVRNLPEHERTGYMATPGCKSRG